MNKFYIPTKVISLVNDTIEKQPEFSNISEKNKTKLSRLLTTLWYFIYDRQRNDDVVNSLVEYTHIYKEDFSSFEIEINKKRYKKKYLLGLLQDVNLVDTNEKYSVKNFSKSYRITTNVLQGEYTEVLLDFNKVFNNLKNKSYWTTKYQSYEKHINDIYSVDIDLFNYIKWCEKNIGLSLKPVTNKDGILIERQLTSERIFNYINDILKIKYKNIWVKVSNEGRLYSSLTNLSYTILPFITINNKKLVEVDVKNCQPLILSTFIDNAKYKKDCEEGIFYDKLSKYLNISRDKVKFLTYKYVFFSNNSLKSGKIYDAMTNLYGDTLLQINKLKENGFEVAKEMQKIESNIFVNKIGRYNVELMLRHDAVFVCVDKHHMFKNVVKKEFKKINLYVSVK